MWKGVGVFLCCASNVSASGLMRAISIGRSRALYIDFKLKKMVIYEARRRHDCLCSVSVGQIRLIPHLLCKKQTCTIFI